MLSEEKLPTLLDAKEEVEEEFFYPSELGPELKMTPDTAQEAEERNLPGPIWPEWNIPKRVRGIPGKNIARFKTGESFRRKGKEAIFKRLGIEPTPHIPLGSGSEDYEDVPQPPFYIPNGELPAFEELKLNGTSPGVVNNSTMSSERGDWGQLKSAMSLDPVPTIENIPQVQEASLIPEGLFGDKKILVYIIGGLGIFGLLNAIFGPRRSR